MDAQSQSHTALRELDHRVNHGIEVRLLWRPSDDRVLVDVSNDTTGDRFTIDVADRRRALDVFHHPYAYGLGPGGERAWRAA